MSQFHWIIYTSKFVLWFFVSNLQLQFPSDDNLSQEEGIMVTARENQIPEPDLLPRDLTKWRIKIPKVEPRREHTQGLLIEKATV